MVMQLAVNQRLLVGLWRFESFSRSYDNIEEQTQGGVACFGNRTLGGFDSHFLD